VVDKEEDERDGSGGGRGTKLGQFGYQNNPHLDFPLSRGISEKQRDQE